MTVDATNGGLEAREPQGITGPAGPVQTPIEPRKWVSLCKGDKVVLLRCGANDKERPAVVAYANDYEFVPSIWLWGFLPFRVPMGVWRMIDEGTTWRR